MCKKPSPTTVNITEIPQFTTWLVLAQRSSPEKQLHNHSLKVLPNHSEHLWRKLPVNVKMLLKRHI